MNIRLLSSICALTVLLSCSTETPPNPDSGLYRVRSKGLYGFVDNTGTVVVKPQYPDAGSFSDGLAVVMYMKEDGSAWWGHIDKQGEYVIPPIYRDASSFREGFAAVANFEEGCLTFRCQPAADAMGDQGHLVLKHAFGEVRIPVCHSFSNGIAERPRQTRRSTRSHLMKRPPHSAIRFH